MPKIPTDQFQVVIDRRRRNLKIRISKRLPGPLQLGGEQPANLGNGHIIGQYSHSRQDSLPDIEQMALPCRRAEGSSVQFPDNYGACKLTLSGDAPQPFHIGRRRPWTQ